MQDTYERDQIVKRIAGTPALRREAMELSAAMNEAAWRTPSDDEIYVAMQKLTLMFRTEDFGEGAVGKKLEQAWLALFYSALREFPIEAISGGFDAYIKVAKSGFVPPPGVLREHIAPLAENMRTAAYRLKRALELQDAAAASEIDRKANHKRLAEAGWLDAEGNFDIRRCMGTLKSGPGPARPTESPQQMAERIRGAA